MAGASAFACVGLCAGQGLGCGISARTSSCPRGCAALPYREEAPGTRPHQRCARLRQLALQALR
eukprot:541771-Alexandrium_andersonii.AAC.1